MKLDDIVKTVFLPPVVKENFGEIIKYGIEKIGDKFFPLLNLDNETYYAQKGINTFSLEAQNPAERLFFKTLKEANKRCWENFEHYYGSKFRENHSILKKSNEVSSDT